MGQKIHPIGFRVGITKKYQCQWFARFHKYNYAQSILEDRMLRTTLMKIFPELLNPLGKKAQKQDSNSGTGDKDNKLAPKITQIKIERGLIPYEISIQIYTENAELIKSAIDNLKINTDLFCYLQKTRQYLLKLKQQINLGDLGKSPTKEDSALTLSKVPVSEDPTLNQLHSELQSESESETEETANKNFNKKTSQEKNKKTLYKNQGNVVEFTDSSTKSRVGGLLLSKSVTGANTFSAITYKAKIKKEVSNKSKKRFFFKSNVRESSSSYASKLAKQQYKKKRLIQRRLKKRQIIAARYGRLISKGLFVKKIGNSIIRHVMLRKSYIKQKQAKRAGITSLATLTDNQAINTNTVATQKKGRLALLSLSLIDKQRVSSGSFALDKSRVQTSALAKKVGGLPTLLGKLTPAPSLASLENQNQNQNQKEKKSHIKGGLKIAYAGIKKKFLSVFINKVNKSFLKHLKNIMSYWHNDLSFSNVSPSDSESVSPSDSESVSPSDSESVSPSDSESDSDLKEKVVGKSAIGFAPLGYGQHWSSSRLKQLQYQPISKLTRLVEILEKKSLIAMGKLRKHYLAFGVLSKTQGLGYYQIITFLKSLKKLITKLRQQMYVREKKRATSSISMPNSNGSKTGLFLYGSPKSGLPLKNNSEKSEQPSALANYTYWKTNQTADSDKTRDKQKDITDKVLRRTLNNVENQCRKIKFISYLKNIVKKHREQNIFYYLRTVADARKDLKQYKKFTKTHAKFLFGLDLSKKSSNDLPSLSSNESLRVRALPTLRSTQLEGEQTLALPISSLSGSTELGTINQQEKIRERVTRVLNQTSALNFKNATEKTLQSSFLNQIEKQKNMSLSNINLMPKISIKFYSIKVPKSFECKASIVADSIIDALEKRKAFRKVIKDAKENLMRTAKVKGVKIQVAGRLNGAEIARTEWVRAGRVPLQTLRANIDYISCPAHTIYGIIGIKVWIFKGYSKIN